MTNAPFDLSSSFERQLLPLYQSREKMEFMSVMVPILGAMTFPTAADEQEREDELSPSSRGCRLSLLRQC